MNVTRSKDRTVIFSLISGVFLTLAASPAHAAIEITVTGNGEGAESTVEVFAERETSIEQINETEIENEVDVDLNTGENIADDNTGDVSVETGDIESEVVIENEQINDSQVTVDACCDQGASITIEGNGSDTINEVSYEYSSGANVSLQQIADIRNKVNGQANTGRNTASDNSGDVSIDTGDIDVSDSISNDKVNNHQVSVPDGLGELQVTVVGNGTASINSVGISEEDVLVLDIIQTAKIANDSKWDLNTGDNRADGNGGSVEIKTGDIDHNSRIDNDGVNVGEVTIDACCGRGEGEVPYDPGDPGDPGTEPDGGPEIPPVIPAPVDGHINSNGKDHKKSDGNDDEDDTSGEVLGATFGDVLPSTGSNWMLLALMSNILMFLLGVYLRMHSGRAPAYAYLPAHN